MVLETLHNNRVVIGVLVDLDLHKISQLLILKSHKTGYIFMWNVSGVWYLGIHLQALNNHILLNLTKYLFFCDSFFFYVLTTVMALDLPLNNVIKVYLDY